uniref:Myristylated protein n=1 Tax=Strongyloides papillosus TaxID=174720 RepID=A0A0N5B3X4_STREA
MTFKSIECDNQCMTSSLDIFNGGNSLKVEYRGCLSKQLLNETNGEIKCGIKKDLTEELKEANVIDKLSEEKKDKVQKLSLRDELSTLGIKLSENDERKVENLLQEGLNKKVNFDNLYKHHEGGGTLSVNCCNKDYCNIGDRHCVQKMGITGAHGDVSVNFEIYDSNVGCEQRQCMTTFFKIKYNLTSFDVDYRDCLPKEDLIDRALTTCGKNVNMEKVFTQIERDADKYINEMLSIDVNARLNRTAGVTLSNYDGNFKSILKENIESNKENISKIANYTITAHGIGGHYIVNCCNKDYCNMSGITKFSIGLIMSVIFLSLFV